jgi:hypothetical protein
MKAVVRQGPRDVNVKNMPDPKIQCPGNEIPNLTMNDLVRPVKFTDGSGVVALGLAPG